VFLLYRHFIVGSLLFSPISWHSVDKYRNMALTDRVLKLIKKTFHSVCQDFEASLIEFEGEGDHVHLLIDYPPKVSISKLVGSLKGVSSGLIRERNIPEIRKNYWESPFRPLVVLLEVVAETH